MVDTLIMVIALFHEGVLYGIIRETLVGNSFRLAEIREGLVKEVMIKLDRLLGKK